MERATPTSTATIYGAELVVFPELSLTGYEPELARGLALGLEDPRLDVFQRESDASRIAIAVGAPTSTNSRPYISLMIFQPGRARQRYSKQHLHPDEEPYFAPGETSAGILDGKPRIALAICYELPSRSTPPPPSGTARTSISPAWPRPPP